MQQAVYARPEKGPSQAIFVSVMQATTSFYFFYLERRISAAVFMIAMPNSTAANAKLVIVAARQTKT